MDDLIDGDTMIAELNKQVQVAARKPADGLSIVKYYDIASQLERQAKMYLADSDMERAYVMFFRFSSFFLTTIAAHKSYKDSEFTKIKTEYRQKCDESLKQCETLKKEIKDKYDGLVMAHAEKRLADLTLEPKAPAPQSDLSAAPSAPAPEPSAPPAEDVESTFVRQKSWDLLKIPEQKKADPEEKVVSASPAYPSLRAGGKDEPSAAAIRSGAALPGQKVTPAPAAAPAKASRATALFNLRPLTFNADIMNEFLRYASANTRANIETCGILCGQIKKNELLITAVVLPKQKATSDTCVTQMEEELITLQDKHNLITLGWIHTHPSQTCFLSSIDLHTHYSYQIMMPEAIAIVMAPSKVPNRGVFNISPLGLDSLKDCNRTGFHQHKNSDKLWGPVSHVNIDTSRNAPAFKFYDLR